MRRPLILVPIFAALILFFSIIAFRDLSYKPNVDLKLSPTTAKVMIDDKNVRVKNSGIFVVPGKHTIVVSQAGFTTYRSTIDKKDSPLEITVVLDPVSEEGFDFMKKHPSEQRLRESLVGSQAAETGKSIAEKNPIISLLPYIDQYFRIDYGQSVKNPSDSTAVAIYITPLAPDGKERALALLRLKGYDPNTLEIIYRDSSPQGE